MGRDIIVYWPYVESDPEPVTTCPGCGDNADLIPSTGVCESCTETAYDRYAS